jgi:PHD/YefM family antitoxin component YafN of YafNO toxin-antitoxin module
VLISQDNLDSLHETVFWLSQPGLREDLAEARRAVQIAKAADGFAGGSEIRVIYST